MSDTGPTDGAGWLSLDRYDEPALSFEATDDGPVLLDANAPFEESFGSFPAGTPVSTLLDGCELTLPDETRGVDSCLRSEEGCTVRVDGVGDGPYTRYLARVVPPAADATGHVLFVEATPFETVGGNGSLGIDHVASVVSHDLRNPLDVAKARLRAGRELDEDDHFDHVERAHDRMERIIDDVLTLARGEEVIDPSGSVDLRAIAESAWETVETDDATLVVDDSLPTVVADPDRVGRLFENLFRNAVEHGTRRDADGDPDEETVEVDVGKPRPNAGENGRLELTVGRLDGDGFYVADDGLGIPEAEQELVFEPGYSSENGGTGLGLAIVERIAEAHGWSVDVTTEVGGGARFEITGLGGG